VDALVAWILSLLLGAWLLFWVIRLGVRYGVDDALRRHRDSLRPDQERRTFTEP